MLILLVNDFVHHYLHSLCVLLLCVLLLLILSLCLLSTYVLSMPFHPLCVLSLCVLISSVPRCLPASSVPLWVLWRRLLSRCNLFCFALSLSLLLLLHCRTLQFCCNAYFVYTFCHNGYCLDLSYTTFRFLACALCTLLRIASLGNPSL